MRTFSCDLFYQWIRFKSFKDKQCNNNHNNLTILILSYRNSIQKFLLKICIFAFIWLFGWHPTKLAKQNLITQRFFWKMTCRWNALNVTLKLSVSTLAASYTIFVLCPAVHKTDEWADRSQSVSALKSLWDSFPLTHTPGWQGGNEADIWLMRTCSITLSLCVSVCVFFQSLLLSPSHIYFIDMTIANTHCTPPAQQLTVNRHS